MTTNNTDKANNNSRNFQADQELGLENLIKKEQEEAMKPLVRYNYESQYSKDQKKNPPPLWKKILRFLLLLLVFGFMVWYNL